MFYRSNSDVVDSLFVGAPIKLCCFAQSLFCDGVLNVIFIFAIIWLRKKELAVSL